MQALHKQYPDYTSISMGFHPTEVNDDWRKSLDAVYHSLGDGNHYVAIGEVGIDLYWDKTFRRELSGHSISYRWSRCGICRLDWRLHRNPRLRGHHEWD